jgi:nitroreductase
MATVADEIGTPTALLSADEVLTTTRTVRKRLDFSRPVPIELVEECLRIAQQAPIGSNVLHPHFVLVTDPDKKAALGRIYARACEAYMPLPISIANLQVDDPCHAAQQPRVLDSAIHLAQHMGDAPLLVVPTISPRPDTQPNWIAANVWGSVLPLLWSFMLAARSRGLVSAWTQLHVMFEEEAAEILGIPFAEVAQGALIPVAYPVGTKFKAVYREPLAQYLHFDTW